MHDGLDPLYLFLALLTLIILAIMATIDFREVFQYEEEVDHDSDEE